MLQRKDFTKQTCNSLIARLLHINDASLWHFAYSRNTDNPLISLGCLVPLTAVNPPTALLHNSV